MVTLRFNKDQQVALLRGISLFAGDGSEGLRSIATLRSECDAKQEDGLMEREQVSPGGECFVIVEGTATVSRNGVQLAHLGPGDSFGELAPLDGGPRTATVVAASDLRLLEVSRREFFKLRASFPAVSGNMMAEDVIVGTRSVDLAEMQAS